MRSLRFLTTRQKRRSGPCGKKLLQRRQLRHPLRYPYRSGFLHLQYRLQFRLIHPHLPIKHQTQRYRLGSGSTSLSTKPPLRKPRPRKPKTTLTPSPGPSKAKKLSMLNKSAMDWQAHVHAEQESGLKGELEANRRTGGYLEKVQFLKRVEERKDETFEALKSIKRRKL